VRTLLFVFLGVDCLQVAAGFAAFERARRSIARGAPSHGRYSFSHGALLLTGALVLLVPVVLGLARVIASDVALYVALGLEVCAFVVSRPVVRRFEAAHLQRRPEPSPGN
jgi:hypothetical protein